MRWHFQIGLLLLVSLGAIGGCSGQPTDTAAADGSALATDPKQLDADFLRAYRAGFSNPQQESPDAHSSSPQPDAGASAVDRDFVAGYSQLTALRISDVAQFVGSGEADALLRSRYRDEGLSPDALLSANVLLFVASWEAYAGTRASPEQVRGLREQMDALWTKSAAFERSAEGQRQRRLYELLAAVLMRESARVSRSTDAAEIASFRETVRDDFLRQSNNDLARYDLTKDGFVER